MSADNPPPSPCAVLLFALTLRLHPQALGLPQDVHQVDPAPIQRPHQHAREDKTTVRLHLCPYGHYGNRGGLLPEEAGSQSTQASAQS